ncbi:MAG: creatininase family protein [Nitrososphaerales archaeon]
MNYQGRKGPIFLEELSAPEIKKITKRIGMVILPVGATEQHGHHLPVSTDTLCCLEVAKRVSLNTGVPLAPTISYGHSEEHKGFPGTFYMRPETIISVIEDICTSMIESGFQKILILYAHLPNQWPIECACNNLRHDLSEKCQIRAVRWSAYGIPGLMLSDSKVHFENSMGPHAGAGETSCILHIRPDLVHRERIKDEPDMRTYFNYSTKQVSRSGISGRPSLADIKKGEHFINSAVDGVTRLVRAQLREKPKKSYKPF